MFTAILRKCSAGVTLVCMVASAHAQIADTRWRVQVMDLQHKVKVEGTIRLTEKPETGSCIAGHWKQAVVETTTVSDEKFFPLAEPLAYEIENGAITFGRTRVCDDYLFLTGKLDSKIIQGTFHAPSPWANGALGYFSLTKIP